MTDCWIIKNNTSIRVQICIASCFWVTAASSAISL